MDDTTPPKKLSFRELLAIVENASASAVGAENIATTTTIANVKGKKQKKRKQKASIFI